MEAGMYADIDLPNAGIPNLSGMAEKMDTVLGLSPAGDNDEQYVLLEQHCYLELPEDTMHKGKTACPYIVTVEEQSVVLYYQFAVTGKKGMSDMKRKCTSPITDMFLVLVFMGWGLFTSLAILLCLPLLLCAVCWTQGSLLICQVDSKLKEYESWATMTRLLQVNLRK
jgi:hypothetical protein